MSTSENDTSYPLGYCQKCNRMRWIQEVDHEVPVEGGKTQPPMPVGRCTQCVREGRGSGSELLGTEPSENFSADEFPGAEDCSKCDGVGCARCNFTGADLAVECVHGYTSGCPDCDVPAYLPTVLQNVKLLREIRTIGGEDDD